jgi:hypothetical protein
MPVQLKGIALGALFLVVSFLSLNFNNLFLIIKNYMHFGGNAKSKGGTSILSLLC